MDNKMVKKKNPLGIALMLLIAWILIFVVISGVFILREPVSFSIQLEQHNISYGQNVTLHYSVSNWLPSDITNITVSVQVQNYPVSEREFHYNSTNLFSKRSGTYSYPVYLYGNQIVDARVSYLTSQGTPGSKELTLGFSVQ